MWVDSILGLVTPSICKGCGEVSSAGLCNACLKESADEPYPNCIICNNLSTTNNLCKTCHSSSPLSRVFVISKNSGTIKRLVYDYKLLPERHLARTLACLLDESLPILPPKTIISPIPTIQNHIRQRGFGHMELVAKIFARKRHLSYRQLLVRTDNAVLHDLKARDRKKTASKSFAIKKPLNEITNVLLIDDIYTTGSTANTAAHLLSKSGVKNVNLAIIARHSKNS